MLGASDSQLMNGLRHAQSEIAHQEKESCTTRAAASGNPAWLREDPVGSAVSLPVRTRPSLLPFHQLTPEDFERLCLRLSERGASAEAAWSYGKSGHTQHGIDVLVRIRTATFMSGKASDTKSYRRARSTRPSLSFSSTSGRSRRGVSCWLSHANSIPRPSSRRSRRRVPQLQAKNIEFEPLDASKLTRADEIGTGCWSMISSGANGSNRFAGRKLWSY